MNTQIQSINFVAHQKLKDFIKKKVDKLIVIQDSIINASIYLKIRKPDTHENKIVEIKLHSPKGAFFAKKTSNTFEESADLAAKAIRKQILKQKKK